jgi:hypothetical protein
MRQKLAARSAFSKVLSIVTFYCTCTRALTFEAVCPGEDKWYDDTMAGKKQLKIKF